MKIYTRELPMKRIYNYLTTLIFAFLILHSCTVRAEAETRSPVIIDETVDFFSQKVNDFLKLFQNKEQLGKSSPGSANSVREIRQYVQHINAHLASDSKRDGYLVQYVAQLAESLDICLEEIEKKGVLKSVHCAKINTALDAFALALKLEVAGRTEFDESVHELLMLRMLLKKVAQETENELYEKEGIVDHAQYAGHWAQQNPGTIAGIATSVVVGTGVLVGSAILLNKRFGSSSSSSDETSLIPKGGGSKKKSKDLRGRKKENTPSPDLRKEK